MAVAQWADGWRSAAAAGGSPGFSLGGRAWVGGFDVLCLDLDLTARWPAVIPVDSVSRVVDHLARVHVVAILCLMALAWVTSLPRVYDLGVIVIAVLLFYEQSLVSADDLSQVKRAFDLNGYVGILYLIVLAVSIYVQ